MDKTSRHIFADALGALRRSFTAVGAFSLVINLLMLTVPLHMMHVYDHVLPSRSGATLFFLSLLAVALLAALGLLEMFRSRILVRIGARLDHALGDRLFVASLADKIGGRSDNPSQPMRDLDTLRNFFGGPALPVLFDAPWAPLFLGVIFLLHPLLGLVALGGALVLFGTAIFNEVATRRMSRTALTDTLAAGSFADATLRNAEVIEAMGMAPAVLRRWRERQGAAVAGHARVADRMAGSTAVAKFWRPFLQVAMLSAGAWLALEHIVSPGVMIASSIIMGRALAPVEGAIASWRGFVAARGAYGRLREMLARRAAIRERMPIPDPTGQVSAVNLFVAPPRTLKPVLKGLSFDIAAGEVLAVIGPSASGKSTLARALVGVWPVVSGEIRLDGAALADFDRAQVGRRVGYLPQDIELFDGTVADNIARLGESDPDGVLAAARLAGVHDMILRLPQAYDTPIGAGGEALSGGQRQRIALARAVYGAPALVVLDEPNANLDAEGEEALLGAIAALKARGATVVLIAHRPTLVATVDRILVLRDGMVDMIGPRAGVLARVMRPVHAARAPVVANIGGR